MTATLIGCSGSGDVSTERSSGIEGEVPGEASSTTTTLPTTTSPTTTSTTTTSTTTSTTSTTTTTTLPFEAVDVAPFGEQGVLDDLVRRARVEPPVCTPVADDVTEIDLTTAWTAGERSTVRVFADQGFGRVSEQTAELEVVAADAGFVDFALRDESLVDEFGAVPRGFEEVADAVATLADTVIRYQVDSAGFVLGVTNLDEISDAITSFFDIYAQAVPEEAEEIAVISSILTPDLIETIVLDPAYSIHAFEGFVLDRDEPSELPDFAVNTFGGPDYAATSISGILEPVDADGCVRVEYRFTVDPADVLATLTAMRDDGELDDAFGEGAGTPTDDEVIELVEAVAITNVFQGQYDAGSQRIRRVAYGRFTATSGSGPDISDLFVFD